MRASETFEMEEKVNDIRWLINLGYLLALALL